MSTVSVIIPCYNYGQFLGRCVESVLSQNGPQLAILIIDDASDDETPSIASRLAACDPRVQVRRHEVNQGHIDTYNEGLAWAEGDYTVLLSADDILAPGALSRATHILDLHPSVGFIYGRCLLFSDESEIGAREAGELRFRIHDGLNWLEARCRIGSNPVAPAGVVVRTTIQRQLGGYLEELPHTADMEMWMRFAARAPVAHLLDEIQGYQRIHGANMHFKISSRAADIEQRKAAFDAMFREHGVGISERRRLERLAARALTRDALWEICRGLLRRRIREEEFHTLIEFATSTYLGESFGQGGDDFRSGLRRSGQVLRLTVPFLSAVGRSSRGWIKARMRTPGTRVSWWSAEASAAR